MQYSRHSHENLQRQQEASEEINPAIEVTKKERAETYTYHPRASSDLLSTQSSPPHASSRDLASTSSPVVDTNRLRLDRVVNEHAQWVSYGKGSADQLTQPVNNRHDLDREVEFENMNTDTEDSSQAEGSTTSLLEDKRLETKI